MDTKNNEQGSVDLSGLTRYSPSVVRDVAAMMESARGSYVKLKDAQALTPKAALAVDLSGLTDEHCTAIAHAANCVESYGRGDLAEKLRGILATKAAQPAAGQDEDPAEMMKRWPTAQAFIDAHSESYFESDEPVPRQHLAYAVDLLTDALENGQPAAGQVPEGWYIAQVDGEIRIKKDNCVGIVPRRRSDNDAENILYALASDLIASAVPSVPAAEQPGGLTDEQIIELHDSMFPRIPFDREKIMGNVVRFARAAITAHLARQAQAGAVLYVEPDALERIRASEKGAGEIICSTEPDEYCNTALFAAPTQASAAQEERAAVLEKAARMLEDAFFGQPVWPRLREVTAAIRSLNSPAVQVAQESEQDRDKLAFAIARAAERRGIINANTPLTGPQLVMLCDALATPVAQEGEQSAKAPSFWNSQRKMIEHAIIGLRDGWATRKDAEDALAALAAAQSSTDASAQDKSAGLVKHGDVPTIEITLRQAKALVEFFGGYDGEVSIMERPAVWDDQPEGLYAYCTEYPDEGSQYLGPTEVDDDLAMNGEPANAQAALFPERDQSKSAEQQGMFRKFEVRRVDGSDQPGGKHYGCRYFVLDLNHDPHAPPAMRAYAAACRATHPQLAADIEAEFGAQAAQADVRGAARTDEKIVQQTEELAAELARLDGYELKGETYRNSLSARPRRYWERACIAQRLLTNTDPEDAASAIEAARTPADDKGE